MVLLCVLYAKQHLVILLLSEVNPEEQHEIYMREYAENRMKNGNAMARCRFSVGRGRAEILDFKIYIRIWQDDDWNYEEWCEFCKNIVSEKVTLNNTSYRVIANELFSFIAAELPGRSIWVKINQNDVGVTVKYDMQ